MKRFQINGIVMRYNIVGRATRAVFRFGPMLYIYDMSLPNDQHNFAVSSKVNLDSRSRILVAF